MKIIFKEKNENIVIVGGEKDFKLCIIEYSKQIYIEIIVKQEVISRILINCIINVMVDRYRLLLSLFFKINNKYI